MQTPSVAGALGSCLSRLNGPRRRERLLSFEEDSGARQQMAGSDVGVRVPGQSSTRERRDKKPKRADCAIRFAVASQTFQVIAGLN